MSKNPFLVLEEFISPLQCEELISNCGVFFPNVDRKGAVLPYFFRNKFAELRLLPEITNRLLPKIETHYNVSVESVTQSKMEWYPENYSGFLKPHVENSIYQNRKWKRVNENDFTGVLFLNDFREEPPFDEEYEVCGGKLEFITHNFSFNPARGRLVVYPSGPNFINHISEVLVGNSYQIKFHMVTDPQYVYNMQDFPGDYTTWF